MNLNELIVQNKIVFPNGANYATQDSDGEIYFWADNKDLEFEVCNWDSSSMMFIESVHLKAVADDFRNAIAQRPIPFLLEIVVQTFVSWPSGVHEITQDWDGELRGDKFAIHVDPSIIKNSSLVRTVMNRHGSTESTESISHDLLCDYVREHGCSNNTIPKMGRVTKTMFDKAKKLYTHGFTFNPGYDTIKTTDRELLIHVWDDNDVVRYTKPSFKVERGESNLVMYTKPGDSGLSFEQISQIWRSDIPGVTVEVEVESTSSQAEEPKPKQYTITQDQLDTLDYHVRELAKGSASSAVTIGVILGTIASK